jgi:hypothetical protein
LGIFIILIGFTGLLGFISSLVIGQTFLSDWPLVLNSDLQVPGLLGHFVSAGTVTLGLICFGFLVGIPLLALLFIGTKMVFGYKSNNAAIGLLMIGIWLLALMGMLVVGTTELKNIRDKTSLSNSETIYPAPGKTIQLKLAEDQYSGYKDLDLDLDRFKLVVSDGEEVLLGEPKLDIEKSSNNDCVIVLKKQSRGKTREQANNNIQNIIYNYRVSDSTLIFDPWFRLGKDEKWRDQKVDITLKIPEGMAVYLDESMDKIIYNIDNESDTWDHDMLGKTWVMQPNGLTLKDNLNVN